MISGEFGLLCDGENLVINFPGSGYFTCHHPIVTDWAVSMPEPIEFMTLGGHEFMQAVGGPEVTITLRCGEITNSVDSNLKLKFPQNMTVIELLDIINKKFNERKLTNGTT